MQTKANLENQDPKKVEFSQQQVSQALLGADPGAYACSSMLVQEYHHSVKLHPYADDRKSFDGTTVLIEKVEICPFIELTVRSEGFEVRPKNKDLPVHFKEILETTYTTQGSTL
jgi:hypothetical protein